jgi:hypothetical protein
VQSKKKQKTRLNLTHANDPLAKFAGFSQEFVPTAVKRTEHRAYILGSLRKQRFVLLAKALLTMALLTKAFAATTSHGTTCHLYTT